jgi:hypothetical protein
MVATKEQLKNHGTVPNITLCGLHDPQMNKLTFGNIEDVLKGKPINGQGVCERCLNKWNSEANSDKNYKKAYNAFRKIIAKALRGSFGARR